jgi:hypothetical protein
MNMSDPLPLPQAVRAYWYHLLPLCLFPSASMLLIKFWSTRIGIWFMFISFLPSMWFAAWPVIQRKAKQSFTALAFALYGLGLVLFGLVGGIIQIVFTHRL